MAYGAIIGAIHALARASHFHQGTYAGFGGPLRFSDADPQACSVVCTVVGADACGRRHACRCRQHLGVPLVSPCVAPQDMELGLYALTARRSASGPSLVP